MEHRDITVVLTADRLWMIRSPDPECCLSYTDLDTYSAVDIRDESMNVFSVVDAARQTHIFKSKSRAEVALWIEAIRNRNDLCTENDIIMMAETCSSQAELVVAKRDEELLVSCSTFEGTLMNR